MDNSGPPKQKESCDYELKAIIYAQLAIFVGELISQSEPKTTDGGFIFSADALAGLSHLCNETGHNLRDMLNAKKD